MHVINLWTKLFFIFIFIYISVYLILKSEKNESGRYNPAQPSECRGPAMSADSAVCTGLRLLTKHQENCKLKLPDRILLHACKPFASQLCNVYCNILITSHHAKKVTIYIEPEYSWWLWIHGIEPLSALLSSVLEMLLRLQCSCMKSTLLSEPTSTEPFPFTSTRR